MTHELQTLLSSQLASMTDAQRLSFVRWFMPQLLQDQSVLLDILDNWSERRAEEFNTTDEDVRLGRREKKTAFDFLPGLFKELGLKLVFRHNEISQSTLTTA